ncbi:hypothetical protein HBA_0061 [Sodalis endosymbiont of Henestaris halophilus]|nr:hypothetical protein HBA_0061 [Sodalis endosymbiont of Henestaris halophilus]
MCIVIFYIFICRRVFLNNYHESILFDQHSLLLPIFLLDIINYYMHTQYNASSSLVDLSVSLVVLYSCVNLVRERYVVKQLTGKGYMFS